jgi:hypothetical protein
MWNTETERAQAILLLLRAGQLGHLWTTNGPTDGAVELLEGGRRALSRSQAVLLRVAFDLWNGCGKAHFADVVELLDGQMLRNVLTLCLAVSAGGSAIPSWMASFHAEAKA